MASVMIILTHIMALLLSSTHARVPLNAFGYPSIASAVEKNEKPMEGA